MRSEREARFTLLVKAHQESLWRYLRILGSDEETAADLLQETFLSVWRKPPEERNPHSTRAYLRRVARNLFLMSIRKSRIKTSLADMDQVSVADAEFDRFSADDGESYRQALRQCLEDL
ncbi:MAG: RNA polymerase sigma factor, partial [Planctomycetota bacterium]